MLDAALLPLNTVRMEKILFTRCFPSRSHFIFVHPGFLPFPTEIQECLGALFLSLIVFMCVFVYLLACLILTYQSFFFAKYRCESPAQTSEAFYPQVHLVPHSEKHCPNQMSSFAEARTQTPGQRNGMLKGSAEVPLHSIGALPWTPLK